MKVGSEIPVGILISMSLYSVYIYMISKLVQMYKIDNMIIFVIYFVPLIILYVGIPIILRKSSS